MASYDSIKILHDTLPSTSGTERHYMDSQRPTVVGDFYELYHITVRQRWMRECEHVLWMNQKTPHKHAQKNKNIPKITSWWWKHHWMLHTWIVIWWHERKSIIKNSLINKISENQSNWYLVCCIKISIIIIWILFYFSLIININKYFETRTQLER